MLISGLFTDAGTRLETILLCRFFMNLRSAVDGLEASSSPSSVRASIQRSFGGEIIFEHGEPDDDDVEAIFGPEGYEDEEVAASHSDACTSQFSASCCHTIVTDYPGDSRQFSLFRNFHVVMRACAGPSDLQLLDFL